MSLADVLSELCDALTEEQAAVRALDSAALESLAATKLRLAAVLREHDLRSAGREELVLAARVHALAHANHLLLEEAVRAIAKRRGVVDTGVYDARARRVTTNHTAGRRI